jgi:EAL domain-containing protein (putative c-di-GMP-specific phosphodiesterase class I)
MGRLRDAGFGISIDDYGAGLSTLTYLLKVPANEVKLDRTLISTLRYNERSQLLIQSTISVAQSLGMHVVAEGVEDLDTLAILRTLECNLAQGYFIGQPVGAEEILSILESSSSVQAVAQA